MIEYIIIGAVIVVIILVMALKITRVPKDLYKNKVRYSDHREKPVKAFYSDKYGLIGKPDFILHTKDGLIPLEIKSTLRPKEPYKSHVMQLISYCLLLEENGNKPKYGFIQYKGGSPYSISYTESKKRELIKIMDEMRAYTSQPKPVRSHRCERCGWRKDCFD